MENKIDKGKYGIATQMAGPAETEPGSKVQVAQWMIKLVPAQHPFWDCYAMTVISLQEVEGFPPANKGYPEAEYEIALYALDPELDPRPSNPSSLRYLTPSNVQLQFHGISREQAADICHKAAWALISGLLPAEPSGIQGARELWHQSLMMTLEHVIYGGHPAAPPQEQPQGSTITPSA